jgi:hypothetical protein
MRSIAKASAAGLWIPPAGSPQARALAYVAERSAGDPIDPTLRVTVNFHPDRLHDGLPILRQLGSDGVYRSQFETGTGSGSLSAYPGGRRWQWESRIFGGAYDDAPAAERPKSGGLNYRRRATGAAARFGSAHLRLRPEVLVRCTFCYPDSSADPTDFGVATRMALVTLAKTDAEDALDDHIETHIHGPLRLDVDIEALVLDPCFRDTEVGSLAAALPCPIEWHGGFRLSVDELRRHPDFRGAEYVELGVALARDGLITPAVIGDAACSGQYDGQDLKKVWHYLARFGSPGDA